VAGLADAEAFLYLLQPIAMSDALSNEPTPSDFIRDIVREDVQAGKNGGKVVTRFPPEPNGFLHLGHAKAICLDFGIAKEFSGRCHLRMDDTNPTTEDVAYVEAIKRDVKWLGFDWGEHLYYASDYFERYYELGELLIRRGRAYVDDLSDDEFSEKYRGSITEPGKESPYRSRSVEENLDLFRRMRKGEFKEGEKVLRAKIDMSSPNMKMRDPPLVRIKHAHHYRTGDAWCIYPLYDYAHCLEDSFEGVTHSLCTTEFESARELYDWVIQATEVPHVPRQYEFAKLSFTYIVLSKRRLLQLVQGKHVDGWDDPRMPTLAGLRRRGVTPEAIRDLVAKVGVAKNVSTVDIALLEACIREDLDRRSPRVMCVQRPLELIIESYPENEVEELDAPYWPQGTEPAEGAPRGSRKVPFSRRLFIEQDDFAEVPPKGWKRLAPGGQVRLRHGYIVTCTRVEKAADGSIARVVCTHDPATRGGGGTASKSLGTIHWVSAAQAKDVEVRVYDRLFKSEHPGADNGDWLADINPASLTVVRAKAEPSLANTNPGDRYQFERLGFYYVDPESKPGAPVFNRTVALKDGWAKVVGRGAAPDMKMAEVKLASKPPSSGKGSAGKTTLPAVPDAKRRAASSGGELSPEAKALADAHGLTTDEARVLAQETLLRSLFDAAIATGPGKPLAKPIASLLVNDLLGELRSRRLEAVPFDAGGIIELVALAQDGTISTKQAKDVLAEMLTSGKGARAVVEARGMKQIASADALGPIVDQVLASNADAVARYKAGNANVFGALVGMVMKQTKGQGNPKLVSDLLKEKLAG